VILVHRYDVAGAYSRQLLWQASMFGRLRLAHHYHGSFASGSS
jgi:hypothetical protein